MRNNWEKENIVGDLVSRFFTPIAKEVKSYQCNNFKEILAYVKCKPLQESAFVGKIRPRRVNCIKLSIQARDGIVSINETD